MGKVKVTLSMDEDAVSRAKEIGLNISKVSENALKEAIRRLEGNYPSRDPGIYRKPYSDEEGTRKIGFKEGQGNVVSYWWAEPDLNRRPSPRKGDILTKLDDQPMMTLDSIELLKDLLQIFAFQ